MKSKNFKKKLVLNKKTIADLKNGQLGLVKGGILEKTFLTHCAQTGYCFTCGPGCPTYTLDPICY
jgi:hypothetical protein